WQAYERKLLEQVSTQMAIAIQQATLLQQVNDLNVNLEQQVAERTAQLKQQMAEVQERNRLLRFSLHAVSHDLRTSAVGSLMVLQSLTSSGEAAISVPREVLQRMQQGAEQQLHKLESLQDIYTAKTVGLVLNRSAVTLASLAKRSAQELASLFEESQAELMLELPEDLPTLWVDPDTICQVFRQLLTNAITHNAPGIKITISARQTGDRLCCRIEDTGKGLSPAHCARLFELCTDALDVRHYGRICLGLYRCRQIIEAHQGTIAAVTPSVGVAIEFTLPYLQASK
ncbi:MAG: ATP-binding protein, partial [Cyanobacteria bacterium P01_A01_bin.135]